MPAHFVHLVMNVSVVVVKITCILTKCKNNICYKCGKSTKTLPHLSNCITTIRNNGNVILTFSDSNGSPPKLWMESCIFGKTTVNFLIDTASQVTLVLETMAINSAYDICTLTYDESNVTA